MKKIALVNVFFPPQSIGGATRVVADNFEVLRTKYKDQLEITIFTSDVDYKESHQLNVEMYEGCRVYRTSCHWREFMDWHAQDPQMAKIFKKFLEFEKPDLVHFHCVQRLSASIVEITRKMGIEYLITLHDAWWISDYQFLVDDDGNVFPEGHLDAYNLPLPPNGISREDSLNRKLYLKELLMGAKNLLAVSESFTELYSKNGFPQCLTNKNGISSSVDWKQKDTSYTNNVVLGHIGGMSEHKGYNLFYDAIKASKLNHIEVILVDHSKTEDFISISHWNNVKVTTYGRQSQSSIVNLYGKIDVLFAPSIWPESYGLVTREATACGCWVVASDIGGIGEDIKEGMSGYKIKANSKIDIQKCIINIDSDSKKHKKAVEISNIRIANDQVDELIENFYFN